MIVRPGFGPGPTARRAALFSLLLGFSTGLPLLAQQLTISYLEGSIARQTGSSWAALSIGDPLASSDVIRVEGQGCVEIGAGGTRITVTKPGRYSVKDLLTASRAFGTAGAGPALSSILRLIASGTGPNEGSVGGARAAEKGRDEQGDEWASSEATVFLQAGTDLISSQQYAQAIDQLKRAAGVAEDEEADEVRYRLAEAYSLNGDVRSATTLVTDFAPSGSATWFPDFVLLKAKILIDGSAYDAARTWLTSTGAGLSGDAQRGQTYYFLLGLSSEGAGDVSTARTSFERVVTLSPESDLGKAAARLMQ